MEFCIPEPAANAETVRLLTEEKRKLKIKFAMIGCDFIFPI